MIRIKSAAELQLAPQKCPDWLSKRAGNGYPCAETFRDTFGWNLEPWMYDEFDVSGITENEEVGIKYDEGKPRVGFMLQQFSLALTEVAKVATFGAKKYGAGNWQHVEQERYQDALGRHLLASGVNDDTNLLHKAHLAWNALADLELELRNK